MVVCKHTSMLHIMQGAHDLGRQQEAPVFPDLAPMGAAQAGQKGFTAAGAAALAAQSHDTRPRLLAILHKKEAGLCTQQDKETCGLCLFFASSMRCSQESFPGSSVCALCTVHPAVLLCSLWSAEHVV